MHQKYNQTFHFSDTRMTLWFNRYSSKNVFSYILHMFKKSKHPAWRCHTQNKRCRISVKSLMSCPFTGPKMFWAGPSFLCETKDLFTYCGSHKHFLLDKKDDLHSVKLVFVPVQQFLKRHYMHSNFWAGSKHFGTCKRTRH